MAVAFVLAGALMSAPSASAGTASAAADPINCGGWWHFTGNDPSSARMVRWGGSNGRPQFNLMYGKIQGIQHGWAQLSGAKQGDWVTLDVTSDGGRTWATAVRSRLDGTGIS